MDKAGGHRDEKMCLRSTDLGPSAGAKRQRGLRELVPEPYPAGSELLSVEIDQIVYGVTPSV